MGQEDALRRFRMAGEFPQGEAGLDAAAEPDQPVRAATTR